MKTKTKVRAGYGRVLVRTEDDGEQVSRGGIIVATSNHDQLVVGTIVAVGPPDERYGDRDCGMAVGDRVKYAKFKAAPKTQGGKEREIRLTRDVLVEGEMLESVLQVEVVAVVG